MEGLHFIGPFPHNSRGVTGESPELLIFGLSLGCEQIPVIAFNANISLT